MSIDTGTMHIAPARPHVKVRTHAYVRYISHVRLVHHRNPVEAVRMAVCICRTAESVFDYKHHYDFLMEVRVCEKKCDHSVMIIYRYVHMFR